MKRAAQANSSRPPPRSRVQLLGQVRKRIKKILKRMEPEDELAIFIAGAPWLGARRPPGCFRRSGRDLLSLGCTRPKSGQGAALNFFRRRGCVVSIRDRVREDVSPARLFRNGRWTRALCSGHTTENPHAMSIPLLLRIGLFLFVHAGIVAGVFAFP